MSSKSKFTSGESENGPGVAGPLDGSAGGGAVHVGHVHVQDNDLPATSPLIGIDCLLAVLCQSYFQSQGPQNCICHVPDEGIIVCEQDGHEKRVLIIGSGSWLIK